MVATVPFDVLRGIYLGILTGVVPALIAFAFGFGFRYVTGVTVPAFAVVVLGLALAGVNGGLLALADPAITQQANSVILMTAVVVVSMLTLYTHAKGDALAAEAPKQITWQQLRDRTVSSDVIELVGGRGQVTIEVVGGVEDMEGYPSLPDTLRAEIEDGAWQFPADLTLSELRERLTERLRTEFDLQDVAVTLDERGRASVVAAPPAAGVSSRVPAGNRAVSVQALVPTGVARGDVCTVIAGDTTVEGRVVSARSGPQDQRARQSTTQSSAQSASQSTTEPPTQATGQTPPQATGQPSTGSTPEPPDQETAPQPSVRGERAPTTTGGEGRITVAVPPSDAETLLGIDRGAVVVESRGTRREYELLSLLRRTGRRIRRIAVDSPGPFADETAIGDAGLRETYEVAILAHRHEGRWTIAPRGEVTVAVGDEVFAVGTRSGLDAFAEAVS
jgi:hypothetical protein